MLTCASVERARDSNSALSPLSLAFILLSNCAEMYSRTPKTPNRSKSVNATSRGPFTPSMTIDLNLGSLTISSPTKGGRKTAAGDITNPFLKTSGPKSRPTSPIKRATGQGNFNVNEELKRQASMGMMRKGAVESRMDVITVDRTLPKPTQMARSKSQPAVKVLRPSLLRAPANMKLTAREDLRP